MRVFTSSPEAGGMRGLRLLVALSLCGRQGGSVRPKSTRGSQAAALIDKDLEGFGAFVINLDSNPQRLAGFMDAVGKSQPWMTRVLQRVAAVDGRKLLANESARKELLGRGLIRPADLQRAMDSREGSKSWSNISPGAVGLYLSHSHAWREIVDRGLRYGLIFEDDLRFYGRDFKARLKDILRGDIQADIAYFQHCMDSSSWPPGADRAESSSPPRPRQVSEGELVPCLASYVLSERGARQLLKHGFPISQQLDLAVSDSKTWRGLSRIVFEPALSQVGQESYISSVQANSLCQQWGWKMVSFLGMWSRHLFSPFCAI